jgi:hypothetical protein
VVEESDAGPCLRWCIVVKIHADTHRRLARHALHRGAAREQLVGDRGPGLGGLSGDADPQAADAEVGGERQVGVPIADHDAGGEVDAAFAHPLIDERRTGLAAAAAIVPGMRTDEDGLELETLRAEGLEHERVRPIEALLGEGRCAEAILVGHHGQPEPGVAQLRERSEDARQEPDLVEGVDLFVVRFFDQGAVSVDEQDLHARLRSIRSFWPGVPTVSRRASPRP